MTVCGCVWVWTSTFSCSSSLLCLSSTILVSAFFVHWLLFCMLVHSGNLLGAEKSMTMSGKSLTDWCVLVHMTETQFCAAVQCPHTILANILTGSFFHPICASMTGLGVLCFFCSQLAKFRNEMCGATLRADFKFKCYPISMTTETILRLTTLC